MVLLTLAFAVRLQAVTLTILHTSDLHGRVDPRDALADRDLGGGLGRVAAVVKHVRAEGNPTLLLDSGDTIQGDPAQALVFAGRIGDGTDPIVRAMNLLGYDAMAVGNHEFDFGLPRLEKSRAQAKFPWLSANTLDAGGRPAFPAYVVKELAGVRVGILGLVTPGVAGWESPALLGGLRFGDSVEAARRYVPILRGQERCDLVVVIAHEGFERDPGTGGERGDRGENQAYALATGVPGIDLLLAGHAHVLLSPRRLGATWVSQPGRWGEALTRFDVTLTPRGERFTVTDVSGRNLPMRAVAADPAVVATAAPEHEAALRILAEPAGTLASAVSGEGARSRDTGLLDWLHAVQRREGGAELSFCSLLPAQPPEWPAGPLTVRQIWAFYPYENGLVTVEATGRQVRAALERAAACAARPDELGRNCDTLSGADYVLDLSRPAGARVVSLRRGGREVADGDVFTVAINSYRAAGGGGYSMWKAARTLREKGNLRDMLVADARAAKMLRLEPDGNWKIVGSP